MNFIDKALVKLFSHQADEASFEDSVLLVFPEKRVYRMRRRGSLIQIFNPVDYSFLFQISAMIVDADFNCQKEFERELELGPAVIQNTGRYDCICTATRSTDEAVYVWKTGEGSIRVLVTAMIWGDIDDELITSRVNLAADFLKGLRLYPTKE